MPLFSMFHSDPALSAVIIFGAIVGGLLASPVSAQQIRSVSRRQPRREG